MVSGPETSLDRGVPLAEGLVCQPKGLAFPVPRLRCVRDGRHWLRGVCDRDHSHHAAGRLDPQNAASSFNTFLSAVEVFQSLSGRVYLPHLVPGVTLLFSGYLHDFLVVFW